MTFLLSMVAAALVVLMLLWDLGWDYVQRFPDQSHCEDDPGDLPQRIWRSVSRAHPRMARGLLLVFAILVMAALGWLGSAVVVGVSQFRFVDDSNLIITGPCCLGGGCEYCGPLDASSIGSNNLAPDGGGMSPHHQQLLAVDLVPSTTPARSDAAAIGSDVLVVFRTAADGSEQRGYVTHFDGVSFTPPTRLRAPDMDPSKPIRVFGR